MEELRKTFFRAINIYFLLRAALSFVGEIALSFYVILTFIKNINTSLIVLF